ncbi:phosphatase PAP2 family protein [Sphingomonas radiodurans]|uniref:phosphatase PAP2 family protein n=1 Tax=Sphingomonas radiodurans TaxID=2890321 RepID=UPI001E409043|nr:phosphatase PAP2 family protein [Sphingomonas radiodurans]WBH16139.1 phosphatase PAP2 family protein [Sphingomonas radiodurans]
MATAPLTPSLSSVDKPVDSSSFGAIEARPSYTLLFVMVSLIAALVPALGFSVAGADLQVMVLVLAGLAALALTLRKRGFGRLASAIEAAVLLMAASMATACLSVLFATIALPYRDAELARLDAVIWPVFTWRQMFEVLHTNDHLVRLMSSIYQTLLWQPFLLVTLLAGFGFERECWRFVHGWFLTLATCLIVFPFVTAASPYVLYGISHSNIPALGVDTGWLPVRLLNDIRSGALTTLSPQNMTGLISVPSFHAAGATLLFWSFRHLRLIGPAFMALNVAMVATTPLVGAHYFIDIFVGIGVASGMIAVAGSASRQSQPSS